MRLFLVLALIGATMVGSAKDEPKKLKVEIAKGKLTINGKGLAVPAEMSDLEKAFGKPSGMLEEPIGKSFQNVYWHELGINAVQSMKGKKLVFQVRFCFDENTDLSTGTEMKPFTGEVFIDGQQITKTTSKDDVSKKLKNGRNAFGEWRIEYEGGTFNVTINHSEKGTGSVSVSQPSDHRKCDE